MTIKLLGYFTDNENGTVESVYDVFLAVEDEFNVSYYAPLGQHSEGGREYLEQCTRITKEEYLKASGHLFTPPDYLALPEEDEEEDESIDFYTLAWMKEDCTMDSNHTPENMVIPYIQSLKNSGIKEENIFVFKQSDNQREKFLKPKGDDQA